jgi:hypothetical protein
VKECRKESLDKRGTDRGVINGRLAGKRYKAGDSGVQNGASKRMRLKTDGSSKEP